MFAEVIGISMEVYVDDILVKTMKGEDYANDLIQVFSILKEFKMKLNPDKCIFVVTTKKFLSFIINQRGMEANPEKIQVLLNMGSPQKPKDIQKLH
jgi:hypothetical protein